MQKSCLIHNPYRRSGIFKKITSTSFDEILYLHSKYIDLRCFVKKLFLICSVEATRIMMRFTQKLVNYMVFEYVGLNSQDEQPSILGNWSFAIYKWQNNNQILTCFWSLFQIFDSICFYAVCLKKRNESRYLESSESGELSKRRQMRDCLICLFLEIYPTNVIL